MMRHIPILEIVADLVIQDRCSPWLVREDDREEGVIEDLQLEGRCDGGDKIGAWFETRSNN